MRSPGPRNTVHLSDSIQRQLNAYALAAGAAGVGVLALVQATEAKIIYTPIHKTIKLHQHYDLDLNHDGIVDFAIRNRGFSTEDFYHYRLSAGPLHGNGVEGAPVYALPRGAIISENHHFSAQVMMTYVYPFLCLWQWCDAKDRYLGLKFDINGEPHYGWARFTVVEKVEVTATLTGYAYETIPNKAIIAGKTKGPDVITLQPDIAPGSLGRLALGRK